MLHGNKQQIYNLQTPYFQPGDKDLYRYIDTRWDFRNRGLNAPSTAPKTAHLATAIIRINLVPERVILLLASMGTGTSLNLKVMKTIIKTEEKVIDRIGVFQRHIHPVWIVGVGVAVSDLLQGGKVPRHDIGTEIQNGGVDSSTLDSEIGEYGARTVAAKAVNERSRSS